MESDLSYRVIARLNNTESALATVALISGTSSLQIQGFVAQVSRSKRALDQPETRCLLRLPNRNTVNYSFYVHLDERERTSVY